MPTTDNSEIIARLILSTKRKNRLASITDIAADISTLKEKMGGLKPVADSIGISTGMLQQFLSVNNLPVNLQVLVKERKIDSVALVYLLSKLKPKDLEDLYEYIEKGELTSQELKVLLPYRKQHPSESVTELYDRVIKSKNIKVSVIRISHEDVKLSIPAISDIISEYVGKDNLLEVEIIKDYINIKLTKEGEKILRQTAKEKKLSFEQFIASIIR